MSEVTAVPIRPLAIGTLVKLWVALAILVLGAAGLAWWGTAAWQVITLDSGVRYRVVAEGTPTALKTRYAGSPDATLQDTFLAITGRGAAPQDATPVAV